jgi:flagellar hook-associated protein 3 FlgL
MRVASSQFHSEMNTAMQKASVAAQDLTKKMASGQRLSLPSDEPVTSVRISRLTREQAALAQYRENIAGLRVRLQQNETTLDSISKDQLQVRDLLVWALDGNNTSEDVNAMAGSLLSLRDSMFYSANSRDQEGHYLFSGTLSNSPAVSFDATAAAGARYTFTGNAGEQKVVVANGVTQTSNVTLEKMADLLNAIDNLAATLQAPGVSVNTPAVHAQLANALGTVDDTLDFVGGKIAGIGGTQNILQILEDNHGNVSLSNSQALIDLAQLDYGDAAVKLNGYTNALQASQKSYAKIGQLSLFDLL